MRKKSILSIILMITAVLSLASCNFSSKDNQDNNDNNQQEKESYTITFSGATVASQTVSEGGKATKPTDPTKSGYTFAGWYKDSACTQAYDFNSPVAQSFTLYAKWTEVEVVQFTVAFSGANIAALKVNEGEKAIKPADPVKSGYTFGGWYTDSACTQAFDFNTVINSYTILYAKWTEIVTEPEIIKYTVTFSGATVASQTIEEGSKVVKPADPTKSGYTFAGWYKDSACTIAYDFNSPVAQSFTLYAKWTEIVTEPEVIEYTITFSGATVASQTIEEGSKVVKPADPTKSGYTFAGWYKDSACTIAYDFNSPVAQSFTLYAKWTEIVTEPEVIEYTITFSGATVASQTIEEGSKVVKPADPTKSGYTFAGWYKDSACTQAYDFNSPVAQSFTLYAKWTEIVTEPEVIEYTITFSGATVASQTIEEGSKVVKPADPTKSGYTFAGWYKDSACTIAYDFNSPVAQSFTLYAKWTQNSTDVETEMVSFELLDTNFLTTTTSSNIIVNYYTISSGAEMRSRTASWTNPSNSNDVKSFTRSLKLGNPANLTVTAPGSGTLSIWIQNGSSGATTQKMFFGVQGQSTTEYTFAGTDGGSPVVKLDFTVEAGKTYVIGRPSGTVDLYYAIMTCELEKSEITGFEIASNGKVDYLPGQSYDKSSIIINAIYGNGRKEVVSVNDSNVTIDSSNFNSGLSGVYTISVKYKDFAAQEITAIVYSVESLALGFNMTEKKGNSSAGNGVYFNTTVQKIYSLNSDLDLSGLTVNVVAEHPNDATKTLKYALDESEYIVSGFDSSTTGMKTITISSGGKSTSFYVFVVDTTPSIVDDVVKVKVDPDYPGVFGAIYDGYNMFMTIQHALEYLELQDGIAGKRKEIYVTAGTYNEKLEITLPYLSIIGESADTTMIEWDSLYGIEDESGFSQITDSTQTVAVRDTAFNCIIKNITISNYWNSLERFDQKFGTGYSEHRALAILIQADMFKMDGCRLLGYQDTIELMTGRQLISNTYICGTTDFIFGTNNTTYFNNCTIHSITSESCRGSKSDGGYITAFKGFNKGSDYVTYGAIFDGCSFTADADVVADGNTAIARPWGNGAAVMVMNSTIAAHVSTKGYTSGTNKNQRYVAMSGVEPTASTTKFFEYNNTGAGAITSSVNGCTVLTNLTEAAKYSNYSIIFGTTNGGVTYAEAWNPTDDTIEEDNNIYYYFNGQSSPTGASYTYTGNIEGSKSTFNGLEIDATSGKLSYRSGSGDTQFNAGCTITFSVEAGSTVVISSFPGYHYYTVNGVAADADTYSVTFDAATTVVIEATNTAYIYSIIIQK